MKHFTIRELTKSKTADSMGLMNKPNMVETKRLCVLVDKVLDPLREMYGKPIYVNSGYRCAALNIAVGGVPNSQHLRGEAVDITGGSVEENEKLFNLIIDNLEYDQLIWENGGAWVHVSYANRNQIIIKK